MKPISEREAVAGWLALCVLTALGRAAGVLSIEPFITVAAWPFALGIVILLARAIKGRL